MSCCSDGSRVTYDDTVYDINWKQQVLFLLTTIKRKIEIVQ